MGGGAGIRFSIKAGDYRFTTMFNGKSIVIDEAEIDKFDAQGYNDGMFDVRGDILKLDASIIDNEAVSKIIRDTITAAKIINENIRVDFDFEKEDLSTVVFGGWRRGILKEGDSISFDQEIEAYAYFYNIDTNQITEDKQIPFTIKLEGICTEEFGYFYGDVFTLVSPDDSDIEAELTEKALEEGITDPIDIKEYMNANKESEIEHWYEMNNYDNKVNWGVGE